MSRPLACSGCDAWGKLNHKAPPVSLSMPPRQCCPVHGNIAPRLAVSSAQPCCPLLRRAAPAVQYEIDTDSIGNVVCKKADELEAAVTVLARHT